MLIFAAKKGRKQTLPFINFGDRGVTNFGDRGGGKKIESVFFEEKSV